MRAITTALKYAKGLFEVAKEKGKIKEFWDELSAFRNFIKEVPSAINVLQSPIYPPDLKQEILDEIFKQVKLDPEIEKFLRLLVERRRMHLFNEIVEMYRALLDEELGILRGEVIAPIELSPEDVEGVKQVLREKFGKEVYLDLRVDPSIIGGLMIRIGDFVWDATFKRQLRVMQEIIEKGVL